MATVNIFADAQGNLSANLPEFASELTLEQIAVHTGASKEILKSIMRGNKMTGGELAKMHDQVRKQTVNFQGLRSDNKDQSDKLNKNIKDGFKDYSAAVSKSGADIYKAMMKNNNTMQGVVQPLLDGVNGLSGLAKQIPVLGGIIRTTATAATGVASFALGIADEFRAQASLLASEVGGGLYDNMLELRTAAGSAGLFLKDLSSMAQQSGTAIAQLGDNVDDGLRSVSRLSHGFREQTRQFGNYGLTVEELNSLMIDEIDIMSAMGKSQKAMTDNLNSTNGGLNTLLYESTALARMTGQNRREMIKSSMAIQQDTIGRLRLAQMTDDERAEFQRTQTFAQGALGTELGSTLVNIANQAAAQGISVEQALASADPGLMQAKLADDREGMLSIAQSLGPLISSRSQDLARLGGVGGMESALQVLDIQAGLAQRLDNLTTRTDDMFTDAGVGQAQALGLVGADLRRFQAEFLTRLANTDILGLGIKPGDAEGVANFTRGFIAQVGGALGIDADNADLTTGFGAGAQALVAALLAGQVTMGEVQRTGGGGFFGNLGAGAAGGAGGAIATRIAGGALTMAGGALASIGLPVLVIGGVLATLAAGAYFFNKRGEKLINEQENQAVDMLNELDNDIINGNNTREENLTTLNQIRDILNDRPEDRKEEVQPLLDHLDKMSEKINAGESPTIQANRVTDALRSQMMMMDRLGPQSLPQALNAFLMATSGKGFSEDELAQGQSMLKSQAASAMMQKAIGGLSVDQMRNARETSPLAAMLMDMFQGQVGSNIEVFESNLASNQPLVDAILGTDFTKSGSVATILDQILDTLNLSKDIHVKQFQTVESDRYSNKSKDLN